MAAKRSTKKSAARGKGKKAGATAWIVKPFKPEALLKGIAMALEGPPK